MGPSFWNVSTRACLGVWKPSDRASRNPRRQSVELLVANQISRSFFERSATRADRCFATSTSSITALVEDGGICQSRSTSGQCQSAAGCLPGRLGPARAGLSGTKGPSYFRASRGGSRRTSPNCRSCWAAIGRGECDDSNRGAPQAIALGLCFGLVAN